MRTRVQLVVSVLLVVIALPACAARSESKISDQQSLDLLVIRASQAQPNEQCFLYAELVQQMTDFSLRLYAEGEVDKADDMLKQIQQLADKIRPSVAVREKRMKNAEIMLRHAAFRLKEMLYSSSLDDRPLVEQTLTQVNQAETGTMMQVFRK